MRRAYDAGVIEGYGDELRPDSPVTGAHIAVILARALGAADAPDDGEPDSATGTWYGDSVAFAREMGFLPDALTPDSPVTRETAFRALLDAFQLPRALPYTSSLDAFSDTFAYSADTRATMASAVEAGIATGHAGRLRASDTITRAEFTAALFRAVPLDSEDGGVIHGDAELEDVAFDGDVWFAHDANRISLRGVTGKTAVVRSGGLEQLELSDGTRFSRLVLAARGDVELDMGDRAAASTLVIGDGDGDVTVAGAAETVEVSGAGREVAITGEARSVVISGRDCSVRITEDADVGEITVYGGNNAIALESDADTLELFGSGNTISGKGRVGDAVIHDLKFNIKKPKFEADNISEKRDFGLDAKETPVLAAPGTLPIGDTLKATLTLAAPLKRDCRVVWSLNGTPAGEETIAAGDVKAVFTRAFEYSKETPETAAVTCELFYVTADGVAQTRSLAVSAAIENYSDEYYDRRAAERVLALVTTKYVGDYTTQYAIDNDYQDFEKEIWINAQGYGSDTKYLMWVNIATQHVNIFEGVAGEWKLVRSGLVATGSSSPTPTGVWKTTYKQENGWTTGTYTVRPVVRFKGGGYAFHSRLYRPGTWTLSDPSIGFPVSHGCVRMLQDDIQWVFDTIPEGTTVVVF
jgi:lipoprotein-anchoring transpeptidase ErfK/SrfK